MNVLRELLADFLVEHTTAGLVGIMVSALLTSMTFTLVGVVALSESGYIDVNMGLSPLLTVLMLIVATLWLAMCAGAAIVSMYRVWREVGSWREWPEKAFIPTLAFAFLGAFGFYILTTYYENRQVEKLVEALGGLRAKVK